MVSSGVSAQEFRATVKGRVLDSSQAALPGATVSVQNSETNEMATATTNGASVFISESSCVRTDPSTGKRPAIAESGGSSVMTDLFRARTKATQVG